MSSSASLIDYGSARNGARQLRRQWTPAGAPRAAVLIVHGISAHSGRFEQVGATLAQAGFAAVAYDQRGHGKTEGRSTYIDKFSEFVDDVEDHLAQLRSTGLPVVLLGHSMGGLVSTTYACSDRPSPDMLVLSGPALSSWSPQWQITLTSKLAQLAPRLMLRPPKQMFSTDMLSNDPAVGVAYNADPLITPGSTVQLLDQIFVAQARLSDQLHNLTIPTMCLHGGADRIVPATASECIADNPLVTRRVLPGLQHEVFNEKQGPELIADVIDWINRQL